AAGLSGELGEESGTLPFTQTAETAVVGDLVLLHDPLRLDLAGARHGGEQSLDFDPPDDVVFLGAFEDLCQGDGAGLEQLLQLGPYPARLGSLGEGGGPLLVSQFRRLHRSSHEWTARLYQGRLRSWRYASDPSRSPIRFDQT